MIVKDGKEGYYSGFCGRGKRLSSTKKVYNQGAGWESMMEIYWGNLNSGGLGLCQLDRNFAEGR